MDAPNEQPAQTEASAPASSSLWRVVLWPLLISAAFMGSAVSTCAYHALTARPAPEKPVTTTVVRGTSSVITAIRDLASLQTSSYYVERVIDLKDKQSRMFGMLQGEDAILLVAGGEVTAGVNLATMRDGDVTIDPDGKVAYLSLPPAMILSARLDNDRTYVHTRRTDALAQRAETLETRARQEAERTLRDAAIKGGILDRANRNAALTLEALVKSLGFSRVVVSLRKE